MFNDFGALLPVNFNIQFKLFLTKSGYGELKVRGIEVENNDGQKENV